MEQPYSTVAVSASTLKEAWTARERRALVALSLDGIGETSTETMTYTETKNPKVVYRLLKASWSERDLKELAQLLLDSLVPKENDQDGQSMRRPRGELRRACGRAFSRLGRIA